MKRTSEVAFEISIEAVLLSEGYTRVDAKGFDRERAIFFDEALAFIRATQFQRLVVNLVDFFL